MIYNKNLVIGNSSQLSYYFPENYEKISSRDIQKPTKKYDRVYICFSEQRTFIKNNKDIFFDTNIDYTLKVIDYYNKKCNKIIIYGSCELWNNYVGSVDINMPFNYSSTNYLDSKRVMIAEIKDKFNNVIILHPFNFNSIYRKEGFLFYKIFDSIINEKKITIGNTYFYRELLHPKYVVEQSINANSDNLIGSGRLIFVNEFIRNLYSYFKMEYEDYVTEDYSENLTSNEKIFYLKSKQLISNNLYYDTISEIEKIKNKNGQNKVS